MTVRRALLMLPVLLLALGVLVGPSAQPAYACSCIGLPGAEQHRRADAVFTGFAVGHLDTNPGPIVSSVDPIVWTFEVEAVHKGSMSDTVEVVTARSDASCGYVFQEGGRYEVFASRRDGELRTGACSGTRDLSAGGSDVHTPPPDVVEAEGSIGMRPSTSPPGLGSLAIPLAPLVVAFGSILFGIGYHHVRRTRA